MRDNIFDWLVENWHNVAVCGVIIYLLINETTRKVTFKVLCGLFLILLTAYIIMVGCMWIFGNEGLFIGGLVILNLTLLVGIYMGVSELRRVIRLHKKGIRTYGTFIRRSLSSRSSSVVAYKVDSEKYECRSLSPLRKYEEGCEKVPVIYDVENHGLSCIEKHDFAPIITLLSTYTVLEIGLIAITVYFYFAIFS